MKVIRAEVLGFCFGVKRAVSAAEEALAHAKTSSKIYTLGPLIHNPIVLESLKNKGLLVMEKDDIDTVEKEATVLIRAHGTTPEVLNKLSARGVTVLDSTCPRVHASQLLAQKWAAQGYTVILAGDQNHGEVIGITGYAENNVIVVDSKEKAQTIDVPQKAILLAQTTFNPNEFVEIVNLLKAKNNNLLVFNTICTATMERQNALKSLSGKADGIIVIGGKNSANTRRLFETAQTICERTALIENATQIPDSFYAMHTVALTAGASTPDLVIDDVERTLLSK